MTMNPSAKESIFKHGLMCRSPRCGKGRLFNGFLKLTPRCEACGLITPSPTLTDTFDALRAWAETHIKDVLAAIRRTGLTDLANHRPVARAPEACRSLSGVDFRPR